ncbi:hypothetical protein AOCH_004670 [Aspergillus ochraceoroseus]|uniref:Zn(2)-C6 fungal-type domain-containing protein n=1 Tax=Aspergillus ochraceoroseus TaxID=138278 RepID=A0A0F8V2K5_9EURO|nr:hypothetical protein AOCH_004670 [Aspergillus ochraceoroseus]
MLHSRLSLVCDSCKSRKVRCLSKNNPLDASGPCILNEYFAEESRKSDPACVNCQKKGHACVFSPLKRKFKDPRFPSTDGQVADPPPAEQSIQTAVSSSTRGDAGSVILSPISQDARKKGSLNRLYVDQLLDTRQSTGRTQNVSGVLRANENYLASSSVSFFSESRMKALSSRIGDNAIKNLIERISDAVRSGLSGTNRSSGPSGIWKRPEDTLRIAPERARLFIKVYFQQVHPLHPFLDRLEFERRAFSPDLASDLVNCIPWATLYHTILALGCQFHGGGSFEPGNGEAWKLFRVALDLFPKVLQLNTELLEVQAVTSMAIFSLNLSCMQIQGKIISEAARMAQRAELNKAAAGTDQAARCRAFWVIYYIEKTVSFHHGTTSLIFDSDIGSPVPFIPDAIFDGFDWFLASIRVARLYSRTFTELFSINATTNSKLSYLSKIDQIEEILEHQRQDIPSHFRPGHELRTESFQNPHEIIAALRIHFHYHELQIALCRLKLHITREQSSPQSLTATKNMMDSARAIVELTRVICIEPNIPLFILVFMPLSALFILFDLVIHNPTHKETPGNLSLLEASAGYFSSLEYATKGFFPSSMFMEFAYIGRSFVRKSVSSVQEQTNDEAAETISQRSGIPPQDWPSSGYISASQLNEEQMLIEPLSFPLDFGTSVDDMVFPGLEVMDLFGTVVPNFDGL